MAESVRFQTRARTVDHLGREQIADCPTAISELWKNAYDAYATSSTLHIIDGDPVVACLCDDGHGMTKEDFITKWLVIGTESKAGKGETPVSDRNGLPFRLKQGKKGIGRLSAAYLGNLLLLVTKHRDSDFVAALIDWRLFENPYLILDDIRIPITTFSGRHQLSEELPKLFFTLLGNVSGDQLEPDRTVRLLKAWDEFSEVERAAGNVDLFRPTTREKIENTIIAEVLNEHHLAEWDVWKGVSDHGTAMVMSGIVPELADQLHEAKSAIEKDARKNFTSTLWSFLDPFVGTTQTESKQPVTHFTTSVLGWKGIERRSIIEGSQGFDAHKASNLEHILDGHVDEGGVFRGRVKAFGEWIPDVVIEPAEAQPEASKSKVGPFDIYLGAMENERKNSTHSDEQHLQLLKLLEMYSGLMVFRDGFRVMPYGRLNSDYFETEDRRGKNAGREFWNHRQMIGRVAITQRENPNLRDKAGREGIIDNPASKGLRNLVINILKVSARRFFGSSSPIRQRLRPELNKSYADKKKQEDRKKLLIKNRKAFGTSLTEKGPLVSQLLAEARQLRQSVLHVAAQPREESVVQMRKALSSVKQQRSQLRLISAPDKLAPRLRSLHADYLDEMSEIDAQCRDIENDLGNALDLLHIQNPRQLAQENVDSALRHVRKHLNVKTAAIEKLLHSERERLNGYAQERLSQFGEEIKPTPLEVEAGKVSVTDAIALIEQRTEEFDRESDSQFNPIIAALESLKESIDLDLLSTADSEEISGMRSELERLTSLAQLGITVEIIDHELSHFTSTIEHGLASFSPAVMSTTPYRQVQTAYESLSSRLRFLSPLRLSGDAAYRQIYGRDIWNYAQEFFRRELQAGQFCIEATDDFKNLMVYEQPSRLYPVFINLINNSKYWLNQSREEDHRVLLSTVGVKIIVSDNGPGIQRQDLSDLFSLFFTRRKGGRGVGLYLCRANLAAGGHKISYAAEKELRPLSGANFVIELREGSFT